MGEEQKKVTKETNTNYRTTGVIVRLIPEKPQNMYEDNIDKQDNIKGNVINANTYQAVANTAKIMDVAEGYFQQ